LTSINTLLSNSRLPSANAESRLWSEVKPE
jgi:hypothetical protein